jgi:hypothetical protein
MCRSLGFIIVFVPPLARNFSEAFSYNVRPLSSPKAAAILITIMDCQIVRVFHLTRRPSDATKWDAAQWLFRSFRLDTIIP